MVLSLLNNEVLGEDPFYIEITSVGAGTGNYNSFLRLQAGGTEEGYNTDTNNQADNKNGIWTHSLKLSDMAVLTIDGKTYYEVRLDVNEDNTAAGTPITLSELWIMGSAAAATGANFSDDNNYANDFAGFHRVFDLNGSVALQDVNEGSGTDDYRILIPTTSFDPGDVYFTLYSRFTGTDGGFEEWRVLGSDGGTNEPPPAITVNKVANVTTIAEGTPTDVIFTYTLTSQSAASDPLRLDTLVDDSATALNLADDVNLLTGFVFGSNYGTYYVSGDADGDYLLDSTETWTFRYTADDMVLDAGDTRTNVVTVVAHDNEATQVTDSDDASVTGTDVLPAISLVKTANPTSISEGTATNVVYTYAVSSQSKSTDPILLTSFVDDAGTPGLANAGDDVNLLAGFVFGSNHGTYYVSGDADGDYLLDSTEVWNFSYTASNVVKDVSDSPWTNIAVVKGTDDEGNQATAQDDASVTVTDVLPAISLVKTANPTSISEGTATNVVYTYAVSSQSKSTDPILLTSFVDDAGTPGLANAGDDVNLLAGFVFGSNHGTYYVSGDADGDYLLDSTEVWNFSYTASNVVKDVSDSPWTNIAVVKGTDDEGNQATAQDDASVTVTDVLPAISLVKTANPTSISEGTATNVVYTYAVSSQSKSTDPILLTSFVDDAGTPGLANAGDDVNLLAGFVFGSNHGTYYVSGDADGDYLLDSTEVWNFSYTASNVVKDVSDSPWTNIAVVKGTDDEGNQATAQDDASVTVTDVLPAISLVKTANPTSISEGTATNVVYTYAVSSQSKSTDPILLTSFVDDAGTPGLANAGDDVNLLAGFVFGSNHGTYYVSGDADGDYLLDSTEVWNFSYTASNVVKDVSDSPWTNIAVVKGTDDEGNQATAQDDANVTVTDVLPDVAIVKTASTNEVQAGAVTSVTFTYAITNESTVSTDPLTIVSLIDDNGTPLDGLDDKDLSALYVSGDNGNGMLDIGETWIYQWTTDILLMPGESYTNIACVNATDDEGNPVGACDDETIISSVNQAYTPGFWSNNASPIWDGNETTYAKSGGLGLVIGAPKNNAPDGEYKDLLYALKDANADGTANDPTTGFLMIGDWDRNGVADDGNNVIIVSRNYALSLLNASTKEQQDGRYQVSRDVVASWLNYVSGSYVGDADKADGFNTTADYIQEAVDWLIATTSGNEILVDNELKSTAKVGMSSNAWQLGVDTGGTAAFELLAGSTIHANLDYFNNNGFILP